MNTMLLGRSRCGRRAKYRATLKRPMPAFSSAILAPSEWVARIRNSSLGLPKSAPGKITPYRAGRHLLDLRVEVNSDRYRLSSDLTLDEGAYVFCYPQGRNAPNGLTRIGPRLAARRRRGVGDGEGIILPLSLPLDMPCQPRITPRTPEIGRASCRERGE